MSYAVNPTGQNYSNDTDANFRQWVAFVINSLTSGGIVQTTDTGQINPTTVAAPTTTNQDRGYAVFRFADALQSSYPVFFALNFGSTSATAATPKLSITVGTGSNGSGTITGVLRAKHDISVIGGTNTSVSKHVFSGDTNRFVCVLNYTQGSSAAFLSLERMKTAAGADSSTGLILTACITNSAIFAVLPFTGSIPSSEANANCLIPTSDSTAVGTNTGAFPPTHFYFGENVNPGANYLGYRTTDILPETSNTAYNYGANHTYFTLPATNFIGVFFISNRNNNAVMVRYE